MATGDQATGMLAPSAGAVSIWNEDSFELNPDRIRQVIPPLPVIRDTEFQLVKGDGVESLAYLAIQVMKSRDKVVILRAIASACCCLFKDSTNYLGGKIGAIRLTGLEPAQDEEADLNTVLTTNFADAEPVTIGELLALMEADGDELGSYFGLLFLAGNKRVTTKNRTAFNERRVSAATASIAGAPKIFVPDSPYLADEVLELVYATFLSLMPFRSVMTDRVVGNIDRTLYGPSLAFMNMFLLLADSGMSALRIIKEAVIKHPWIRTDFPELRPELSAAHKAQLVIRSGPPNTRPFLKAIHGSNFVPVNYSEINNLTGVAKEVLRRTTPSYANYDGGKITDAQRAKINAHPDVAGTIVQQTAAVAPE